ncbi:MAG: hypothetical protein IMF15_02565 [Proteobacteria bacterium]|nr:hypothetical protein [Pseudomonadota bacterium]
MKQKKYTIGFIALMSLGMVNVAVATDYSSMSTEELMDMRSEVRDMSTDDRDIFRTEMSGRVQSMSDDERASFKQSRGQGSGNGGGKQYRYGKR